MHFAIPLSNVGKLGNNLLLQVPGQNNAATNFDRSFFACSTRRPGAVVGDNAPYSGNGTPATQRGRRPSVHVHDRGRWKAAPAAGSGRSARWSRFGRGICCECVAGEDTMIIWMAAVTAALGVLAGQAGGRGTQVITSPRDAYPARPADDPESIARGKALYGVNCQFCHGADTRGGDGGQACSARARCLMTSAAGAWYDRADRRRPAACRSSH